MNGVIYKKLLIQTILVSYKDEANNEVMYIICYLWCNCGDGWNTSSARYRLSGFIADYCRDVSLSGRWPDKLLLTQALMVVAQFYSLLLW